MIKLRNHKILVAGFCILLPLVYFMFSCTSSKSGITRTEIKNDLSSYELNALEKQKKELNQKSVKIIEDLKGRFDNSDLHNATALNNLFENLSNHFYIDSIYNEIYAKANSESLKLYGLKKLMESADFYCTVFFENEHIRWIINRGDKAHNIPKHALEKHLKIFFKNKNQQIANKNHWEFITTKQNPDKFIIEQRLDRVEEITYEFAGLCSETFSYIVTKFNFQRKNESVIKQLLPRLKKWDIVCQKSPHRLTDLLIPGFFGHAGIYLGNNTFVECNQKGVYYRQASEYLEGDDFIVLRPETFTGDQEKHMETLLKAQLGKKYDFNFNTESPDRVICTEIIFLVYDKINWNTRHIVGWNSISPDDLVKTSIQNMNLKIPLYLTSDSVFENPGNEFVENLLARK